MKRQLVVLMCFVSIVAARGFGSTDSPNLMELQSGWRMCSADNISVDDGLVSRPTLDVSKWYVVERMPATVLQILEDNGVYKDLYYGTNLASPKDLWKRDWWYRTTFTAPSGRDVYSLIFKGINYLADIWLDWINWKYLGYHDSEKHIDIPFVPDRNAGVWKRVFLSSTGAVTIRNPYVATDLPLPALSPAALTVYCDVSNNTDKLVSGRLRGQILRPGKPVILFQNEVSLLRNQTKEIALTPAEIPQLSVADPDLWWPFEWGQPNLYRLKLDFIINNEPSDAQAIDFGVRTITQKRDSDNSFPEIGTGGNFYLQINGRDYPIHGGVYSPDLLFRNDPERDAAIMQYVKDLGLNLIRWESKIADDSMIERSDHAGVPIMLGWMCCAQWAHWDVWTAEDQWVARASLRARIRELRSHPAAVIWASGSDGLPPDPVLNDYREILRELHWQNAAVDTVSNVHRAWSGIHMG